MRIPVLAFWGISLFFLQGEMFGQCDPVIVSVLFQNQSNTNGQYLFEEIAATNWQVQLNLDSLSPQLEPIISFGEITLTGCDDSTGVDFLVKNLCFIPIENEVVMAACLGESIFYNGIEIPAGLSDTFHFTTPNGCDSTVIVSVKTILIDTTYLTLNACADSHANFNGMDLAAGTATPFVFDSQQGCDSVVWVEVVGINVDTTFVELVECHGESAFYAGQYIPAGTAIWLTLTNANGCDSMVFVNVAAITLDTGQVQLAACSGEAVSYNGYSILAGGSQLITFDFSDGCDSSVLVSVAIIPYDTTYIVLDVCASETIDYEGFTFAAGDEMNLVLENQYGCDSLVFISVNAYPEIAFETTSTETCPEVAEGKIEIIITDGQAPFLCALENNPFSAIDVFDYLKSGLYTVSVMDANGCLEQEQVLITDREKLEVIVDNYVMPCGDPFVAIRPILLSHAGEVVWQWPDGTDNQWMLAHEVGTIYFTISDECGTEERAVEITWDSDRPEEPFYMPNAFSPNDDGINDLFKVFLADGAVFLNYELHVFDRWGNHLFYTNDPKQGWDGIYQLQMMNPGVFAWFLKAKVELCGQVEDMFREGDVTLMR